MKHVLSVKEYDPSSIILDGNRFLLGNGHIGYRGTLEEYGKEEMVGLVLAGVYDQYQSSWRENLILPNPFFLRIYENGEEISTRTKAPLKHETNLYFDEAYFTRFSEFESFSIKSRRAVSHDDDSLLLEEIVIVAKKDVELELFYGLDSDLYEAHGPHFSKKSFKESDGLLRFEGRTNEGKRIFVTASYLCSSIKDGSFLDGKKRVHISLKKGEEITLTIVARVDEDEPKDLPNTDFEILFQRSLAQFRKKKFACDVAIEGDEELDFEMAYSIYHVLILGDEKRTRSISARGLSGQTYKGAVFWDTEMFLLPFYVLANPKIAKNLLRYRIKTLPGAKEKAKRLGYQGAYYAWESQDSGLEACRDDNVTDPVTNETIPTYFGTKQIHISADIIYAFLAYIKATGDDSILEEGGEDVIFQAAKFLLDYAKKDEEGYRFLDVIGPDEYHERVDEDAYTSFLTQYCLEEIKKYCDPEKIAFENKSVLDEIRSAKWKRIEAVDGVYPQFKGYFDLAKMPASELRKRISSSKQYWGGPNGIATKTQVIKQADVVALMALLPDCFDKETKKKNFDYYLPLTEHGSSLSASMHSLLGVQIGEKEIAYRFMRDSSSLDLKGSKKEFAGGVYIGGTHPAANAGAYLSLVYGFLGLKEIDGEFVCKPNLPSHVSSIRMHVCSKNKIFAIEAFADGNWNIKEVSPLW